MSRLRTRQMRRPKHHHRWTCKKWVLTHTQKNAHAVRWFVSEFINIDFFVSILVEHTRSELGWREKAMAHCNFGWCQSRRSETLYGHFQDDQRSKLTEFLSEITKPIGPFQSVHFNIFDFISIDCKSKWEETVFCWFFFSFKCVFVYMQVTWMGTSIVVFNDVKIRPPYRLENVSGNHGSKQLNYVRKMVERLTKEQRPTTSSHHSMALMQSQPLPQRRNSNGNGPASSSTMTPSTKITERNASSNIKAN